ncbi:hypothetical protein Tsp_04949, partial [Trichinella spiralis]
GITDIILSVTRNIIFIRTVNVL